MSFRLRDLERKAERRMLVEALAVIAFFPALFVLVLVWVVIL